MEYGLMIGDVATSVLLPAVVDLCKNKISPLTKQKVHVVGAGGIYDGRGVAMALNYGCEAVWVGTRFVCSKEAGASLLHKEAIIKAGFHDTFRTLVYTGRPMRIVKNKYAIDWEQNRKDEMETLLNKGVIPYTTDATKVSKLNKENSSKFSMDYAKQYDDMIPHLSGQIAANINDILPAKIIVQNMMKECIHVLKYQNERIKLVSKL